MRRYWWTKIGMRDVDPELGIPPYLLEEDVKKRVLDVSAACKQAAMTVETQAQELRRLKKYEREMELDFRHLQERLWVQSVVLVVVGFAVGMTVMSLL